MATLSEDDVAKLVALVENNQKNIRTLAQGLAQLQERVKELEEKDNFT